MAITRRHDALLGALLPVVQLLAVGVPAAHAASSAAVTDVVRADTPEVHDGAVHDFAVIGAGLAIVGGTFTQVTGTMGGGVLNRRGVIAFDRATGQLMPFDPQLNGDVLAVEASEDGDHVFLGGNFSSAGGEPHRRIVKLDVNGVPDPDFDLSVSAEVTSLAVGGGKLYIGGSFITMNGVSREMIGAVDAETGVVDPTFDLPITGVGGISSRAVKALDLTPDGSRLLVVHAGLMIDGISRPGIAMVGVDTAVASVTGWRSAVVEENDCDGFLRWKDGEIAPDGTFFVVTSQGGDRMPVCDVAIRFPIADVPVEPDWISRHFDSVLSVAISDTAVYTSGHFWAQEAPDSTNPYPGLATKKYGCHLEGNLNCAWIPLGSMVMPRDQIGALDPETGKTLEWNPGINAYAGAFGMEVIDGDLYVGHDRDVIADESVGRFGVFAGPGDGSNQIAPTGGFASPGAGELIDPGSVTFTGPAEDATGVIGGTLELKNLDTNQWLRHDGTWDNPGWSRVAIESPGAPSTTWSFTATLPVGAYQARVRLRDVDGVWTGAIPVDFRVGVQVDPTVVIESPADGSSVPPGPVVLSGEAQDDGAVAAVKVRVKDLASGLFLQPDGTWGPTTQLDTTVTPPGAADVTWSRSVDLPVGSYYVKARATDATGARSGWVRADVVVSDGPPPGNQPPNGSIVTPSDGEVLAEGSVRFAGLAADDAGVAVAKVRVVNLATGMFLQADGSWAASSAQLTTVLSAPGAEDTSWALDTVMPQGDFFMKLRLIDVDGLKSRWIRHDFSVAPAGAAEPAAATPAGARSTT